MSYPIKAPFEQNYLIIIRNPAIKAFDIRFRNLHAQTFTSTRAFQQQEHPLKPMFLKRYAMRETVPLWWSCIGWGHTARVVRSWLARRTRGAFEESLRKQGFDTNGRPLPESGNTAIFGTAYLAATQDARKISFEDLVKQTDIAVSEILKRTKAEQNKPTKTSWLSGERRNGNGSGIGNGNGNGQKRRQSSQPRSKAFVRNQ